MNIVLWVLQGLAGVAFLMAGGMKAMTPKEKLGERMAWVEDYNATQIRLIGLAEVLGGLGLILPGLTNILPILTPIAATCLVIIMAGAVYTHLRRKENNGLVAPIVLLIIPVVIAIGRFWISPF